MSPRKLVVLSIVVLGLFAFILLFERKLPSSADQQQKGELHWDLPEDSIEALRLEHSGTTVELKKEGDRWRLVRPVAYPAETFAVTDITSELGDLKRVGGESPDGKPEEYGLAPPAVKATVVFRENKDSKTPETRTVEFGLEIPGTDMTAARLSGSDRIVFVPTSTVNAVRKSPDELKSKEAFGGSAADVARIEVERGRGQLVLARKGGTWWLAQPLSDLADGQAAERLAGDLAALRVVEFKPGERKNLAALGLNPPVYRVTLADAKGKSTTVELGSTRADGNTVYGHREGQTFTVESSILDELTREAVAFRSPGLVGFDRGEVSSVEGTFGTRRYVLSRRAKDGGWLLEGKPLLASTADDVLTAILDIKSREFLDDTEARALGERQPEAKISVAVGAERWDIALHPIRGQVEATVSRRPGAFRLDSGVIASLDSAFRKAAASPTTPPPTPTPVSAAWSGEGTASRPPPPAQRSS